MPPVYVRVVSATPPSIAIAAPVLGGPEVVRVVLKQHQHRSWPFTRVWIDAMLRLLLLLNTTRTRSGHTYML